MGSEQEDLQLSGEWGGVALFGARNVIFQGCISVLGPAVMRVPQRHGRNSECSLGQPNVARGLTPYTGPAARPLQLSSLL